MQASDWKERVASVFYAESCCDTQPSAKGAVNTEVQQFVCVICRPGMAFASSKALASHTRAKHKIKTSVRLYVRGTCCPVCGVDFQHRARVLKHLGDTRRQCRAKLFAGDYPTMTESEAEKLDVDDCSLRRECYRSGHTSVLAMAPATKHGKPVGRCTR